MNKFFLFPNSKKQPASPLALAIQPGSRQVISEKNLQVERLLDPVAKQSYCVEILL